MLQTQLKWSHLIEIYVEFSQQSSLLSCLLDHEQTHQDFLILKICNKRDSFQIPQIKRIANEHMYTASNQTSVCWRASFHLLCAMLQFIYYFE